MDMLKSSLVTIGQVVGLVLGSGFTSHQDETVHRYYNLQLHF
jgi:hypothetical protein